MVYLIGVHHAGEPPYSLKVLLGKIRYASRIGIECLSEEDIVKEYEYSKSINPNLKGDKSSLLFWEKTKRALSNHILIPLETLELAKKQIYLSHQIYNERMKVGDLVENSSSKEGWGISKKIFELEAERAILIGITHDDILVQKIKETNPEIVIIGRGHADYFFLEQEKLFGIQIFTKYDAQDYLNQELKIQEGRIPGGKDVAYRTNQKRLESILKTGLLTDEVPDYVGTWNPANPYEGYFEVFIKKNQIIDMLGTARFKGNIKDAFIKEYTNSNDSALIGEIRYETIRNSGGIIKGTYRNNKPFFMTKFDNKNSFDTLRKSRIIQEFIRAKLIDDTYSLFSDGYSGDYF